MPKHGHGQTIRWASQDHSPEFDAMVNDYITMRQRTDRRYSRVQLVREAITEKVERSNGE